MATPLPPDLIPLAQSLLLASRSAPLSQIKQLLAQGAPAWYQDDDLGWSCLHYAAERRDPEILTVLLQGGAVWNAVDKWGRTAGEVCISLGDKMGWELIRNEGLRSEMLFYAIQGGEGSTLRLRAEDTTSAGNNDVFLKSRLTWDHGDDGRERVLDEDGNGVMMGWEEPLMNAHARLMLANHPSAEDGEAAKSLLNVGYGLGIIDRLFRSSESGTPSKHVIIEAHPDILAHMRQQGVYDWSGVTILEGRWQDFLLRPERLADILKGTERGFDAIFTDTFAEGYEGKVLSVQRGSLAHCDAVDLKAFFEVLPDILEPEHGVFSFWDGLGATNPTIYSVASNLAEMHLEDVGLAVVWHDVPIPESLREVWKGVRRKYWELPGYKLPIARMQLC